MHRGKLWYLPKCLVRTCLSKEPAAGQDVSAHEVLSGCARPDHNPIRKLHEVAKPSSLTCFSIQAEANLKPFWGLGWLGFYCCFGGIFCWLVVSEFYFGVGWLLFQVCFFFFLGGGVVCCGDLVWFGFYFGSYFCQEFVMCLQKSALPALSLPLFATHMKNKD